MLRDKDKVEALYKSVQKEINCLCSRYSRRWPNRQSDQFQELRAEAGELFLKALKIYDETRCSSFNGFFYIFLESRFKNLLFKQNFRRRYAHTSSGEIKEGAYIKREGTRYAAIKNEFSPHFPVPGPADFTGLVDIFASLCGESQKLADLIIKNGCSDLRRAKVLARRNGIDSDKFDRGMAEIKTAIYGCPAV